MQHPTHGKTILLSNEEIEENLDQDIDDYEDSRIELQAIGLNLVSEIEIE